MKLTDGTIEMFLTSPDDNTRMLAKALQEERGVSKFKIGDVVTLIDAGALACPAYANNTESVIICKFPESNKYLLNKNLYGYEYWEGRLLQLVPSF